MTKQEIIDYMYENHVQGDFKIEEMAEDLAQPEIIKCKDCKKHNLGIGDYIMEGKERVWIWKPDACPFVQFRGYAEGHEFDNQYCSYCELRVDADE